MGLAGCMTTRHGTGVIIAKQEITHPQKTNQVKEHALIGGLSAGIPGAILGATAVAGPVGVVTGIVVGGGLYGLIGGATGGGVEYIHELVTAKHVDCQYTVQSLQNTHQTYTIRQTAAPLSLRTKVSIFERKGKFFIKRKP